MNLTEQTGKHLRVGQVVLEVTSECDPCHRMESAAAGLRAALETDWRAGAMCVVVSEGTVALGDAVGLEPGPAGRRRASARSAR